MSVQSELFHESVNDAIRDLVVQIGGTKKVGAMLRPEMPADHAARWLNDCLNHDRREKLNPEQLLWLLREGRRVGAHILMTYLNSEAGYSVPSPIEPRDEMAELQREYIAAAKTMQKLAERIERVNLKAVA